MRTCAQCARTFERTSGRGPVPRYCSAACRQAAYRERTTTSPSAVVAEMMANLAEMTAPIFEQGAGLRDRLAAEGWSPTMAEMLAANVTMTNVELLKAQLLTAMRNTTNEKSK